jgi:hypothetical protein
MRRGFSIGVLAFLLCVVPALVAQRGGGLELHGVPASVTDPGPNGVPRGIPASVTDPTPRRVPGNFTGTHGHPHSAPVFALPYYGYYGVPYYDYSDYSQYDQAQAQPVQQQPQQQSQPQVIIIKEEPSTSDDETRYGEHSFDGEDSGRRAPARDQVAQTRPAPAAQSVQDNSPATILVYRDGHKTEVRNYAIVGSNLVDLTRSPILKKIPLDSLNLDATRKANEDNGVDFHTP